MRLLNILQQQKHSISALILSLLVSLFCFYPVINAGKDGVFYTTDPDVVYVANTLSNIKWDTIGYFDHPGTPAITLLSTSYLPIRVFTKFIVKENFITWAFENFDSLFFYSRAIQCLIFALGVFLLFQAVYVMTKSVISQFFSTLFLLSFLPIYYSSSSISAEPTSILLISLWIFLLANYLKKKSIWLLYSIFFVAGLSFANRATTIFYLICSSLLILFYRRFKLKNKIYLFLKSISVFLLGFLIGVFPLKSLITQMIKRIIFFASSTQAHGAGGTNFIDLSLYAETLKGFWFRDNVAAIIFLSTFALSIYFLYKEKDKLLWLCGLFISFGIFIFAKFPLAHYQIPNFLFIVFLASSIMAKFNKSLKIPLLVLIFVLIFPVSKGYYQEMNINSGNTATLNSYVKDNPSKTGTVWEWSRSKDFALLWVRDWSGGVFDDELSNMKVPLSEIEGGYDFVRTKGLEKVEVFDFCWDQLYLQKVSTDRFLNKYKDKKLKVVEIPGVLDTLLIKSLHCDVNKI